METDGSINNYVKQEQSVLRREAARLHKYFDGIRSIERMPGAMFVVDIKREHNAIAEAMAFNQGIGVERKAAWLRFLRNRWATRLSAHPKVRIHTNLDPAALVRNRNRAAGARAAAPAGRTVVGRLAHHRHADRP